MHYEGLLRVPLIVRGPKVPAGSALPHPVSTLDIGPTLFDLGAADPLQTQHGKSLWPLLSGDGNRDFALNEWELLAQRSGVDLSLRTVRAARHKMTVDLRSGAGELYDLAKDPAELVNRFDDPGYAEVRKRLEAYLDTRPDDMQGNKTLVGMA